ncbi:MAG TPA: nucleotide exchange factor GrpE [Planctomycetaceae bacterium]|nr:nucleotide exchange factor GrpE [Planctomycetaceae bacterium]
MNAPDPNPEQTTTGTDSLEAQLKAVTAERDQNRENWLRSVADFENYRKRAQKEAETEQQYRVLPIARDLLPVLDNLQRALQAAKGSRDIDQLLQGVGMVAQQFEDILGRHQIKPIEAVGQPFDPNLHEAIQQAPSAEHPAMTVLHDVERGYRLHDRVVRPTKVIVSTKPAE